MPRPVAPAMPRPLAGARAPSYNKRGKHRSVRISITRKGRQVGGAGGAVCPWASGLGGLIIEDIFHILAAGNALKSSFFKAITILKPQSKGWDGKIFCSFHSQPGQGLKSQICPWASKSSWRPWCAILGWRQTLNPQTVKNFCQSADSCVFES